MNLGYLSNGDPEVRRARLLGRIDTSTECWTWLGSKTNAGYGQMRVAGRKMYTHRIAYELFVGPIPTGLDLDHLCRNRLCCNPEHLEPVPHAVNVARGRPARTHCPNGHPFTPDNVRRTKAGYRVCRTCDLAWQKQKRDRERETRPPKPRFICGASCRVRPTANPGVCTRRVKTEDALCWEHGRAINDVQPDVLERMATLRRGGDNLALTQGET